MEQVYSVQVAQQKQYERPLFPFLYLYLFFPRAEGQREFPKSALIQSQPVLANIRKNSSSDVCGGDNVYLPLPHKQATTLPYVGLSRNVHAHKSISTQTRAWVDSHTKPLLRRHTCVHFHFFSLFFIRKLVALALIQGPTGDKGLVLCTERSHAHLLSVCCTGSSWRDVWLDFAVTTTVTCWIVFVVYMTNSWGNI